MYIPRVQIDQADVVDEFSKKKKFELKLQNLLKDLFGMTFQVFEK